MRICLVVCALSMVGCGATRRWECGEEGVNANVSGEWLLRADGELEDCPEGAPEGDVFLDATVSLSVSQGEGNGGPAPLFLARPVTIDGGTLNFADGEVDGDCVEFTIRETGADYSLTYVFEGDIDGNRIDGDFEATGGAFGGCVAKGGFEVTVVSATAPPDDGAPPDGGPPDGGPPDGGPPDGGPPDGGDSAADDGGDALRGDGDAESGDPRHTHDCYRTEDCAEGMCIDDRCVPVCSSASDCRVGEKCENRRCVDASTGCNCASGSGGAAALLLLALLRLRRRE